MSPPSSTEPAPGPLLDAAAGGNLRAAARLISLVEAGGPSERSVAAAAFARTGSAWVVGVTGPPGAGKSTLVAALVGHRRAAGERVAVVAVDPSSPHTGGALLGDRVRMQEHATDAGVFVRSMASRGEPGGLARATLGAVRVLDAAGWPWIYVETVGAGQAELDVAGAADAVVVVLPPGSGDEVQAEKAGLLEIADVFAVNHSDRPGAERLVRDLEEMLDARPPGWRPPVLPTVATSGAGVEAVGAALEAHRAHLAAGGSGVLEARREARLAAEVRRLVTAAAAEAAGNRCAGPEFDALVAEVASRRLDPLAAAARLLV